MVGGFLEKGFPSDAPRAETILLLGAAQILWLEVPDHAAVDLSVRLAQADRRAGRYAGLVNAVLRRVTQASPAQAGDVSRDTPQWLIERWSKTYGSKTARAIAAANGHEPALDLTVKGDAESWAERLRGRVLPTGTVRTLAHGAISLLPGFSGGRLVGAGRRRRFAGAIVGRCAGQGGRRFVCGARRQNGAACASPAPSVTAVDRSPARLNRLRENLARLSLEVETVAADAMEWQAGPFDAVLLDAPCSSTGTIRRHPDIPWLKNEADIPVLTSIAAAAARPDDRFAQARSHMHLLRLLTRARRGRRPGRGLAGPRPARRTQPDFAAGRVWSLRIRNRGRRPADIAVSSSLIRIRAGAAWMAFMRPG